VATRLFCDANVLYPSLLRDLLIRLAVAGLADLRWSDGVQAEWMRNLLEHQPGLSPEAIARTRQLMERAVPEAQVSGYGHLIPALTLPDPDDRHVLAAAIAGGATHLLTFNLRDFPAAALRPHGLTVLHPDAWLLELLNQWPQEVLEAVERLSAALRAPPLTPVEVAQGLLGAGLPVSGSQLARLWEAERKP